MAYMELVWVYETTREVTRLLAEKGSIGTQNVLEIVARCYQGQDTFEAEVVSVTWQLLK
jgi:hypothetical protein